MRPRIAFFLLGSLACGSIACGGDDTVAAPPDAALPAVDATTPFDATPPPSDAGADAIADASLDVVTDGGPPQVLLPSTVFDFGLAPCGGPPTTAQVLPISNPGGATLDVTLSLAAGTAFSLASPASFTVEPHGGAVITLDALAVPASAPAATPITDTLTITTNAPAQPTIEIPVKVTPSGATLALTPAAPTFGQELVGTSAPPLPLALVNTGNAPITFALGAPSDTQFGLTYTGAPGPITLAPGASVGALQATFEPSQPGTANASAAITPVSGSTICGASATSIPLTGQGTTGSATVSPLALDFGPVACGATASAQSVTVTNAGAVAFSIASATLGKGTSSPYALTPPSGPIAPGGSASIAVQPKAVPAISAVPGDYGDTLTIATTLSGDAPHVVALREAASGAIVAVDTPVVAFGGVPVGAPKSASFNVSNAGDQAATITLSTSGAPFTVAPSSPFALPGGGAQGATVTFQPTQAVASNDAVAIAIAPGVVLCQPPPSSITLSGTGESGGLSLSASSLSFGSVACGQSAPPQSFTIKNTGNAPLTWSAALESPSSPYVISPTTATLDPNGASTITVTPKPIPSTSSLATDLYADTITITTDVPGDPSHLVQLHESATGAILGFSPTQVHFGSVPVGTSTSAAVQLVNSGNAPANVTLASSNGAFGVPSAATLVAANGSATVQTTFAPGQSTATQSSNVSMTAATSNALCAPLPSPLVLDGAGSRGVVKLSAASLDFKNPSCGTAAAAQQITVTNTGNQDFTITALSLGLGASSRFTVAMSPASGVVPKNGGGSVVITITPKAIPATSPVGNGIYSDTLSITTNAAGDAPHAVALTMGAQGVILAASASSIAFGTTPVGATSASSLSVTNSGNVAATISFGSISSSVFAFDQGLVAQPGTSVNPNAYFTPAQAQGYSGSATITLPAGTPICKALPPTITLGGTGTSASTVSITPTSLNFLNVSCGAAAPAARSVTVKNLANQPQALSFSLASGKWYTVTTTPANAVSVPANGGTVTLNVAPKPIPVAFTTQVGGAAYGDTLAVQVGSTTTNVALSMSAQGAVLQFNPASINIARGTTGNFAVVNSGNASAGITLTSNLASFVPSPTSGGATVGSTSWSVKDNAAAAQTAKLTMGLQAGGVICQPLPAPLVVNGF